jgi:hypothetical protein
MSAQRLGLDHAFRCRELWFGPQNVCINEAIEHNERVRRTGGKEDDPRRFLSQVPEYCYLCHIWMTNGACLDQKERLQRAPDLTTVAPKVPVINNRFMVMIDKEGEYDRHAMISDDGTSRGIWGPFPLWNQNNYVLRGTAWEERDSMVFRLAPVSSQPIASQPTTGCTPSAPTGRAPANTGVRH